MFGLPRCSWLKTIPLAALAGFMFVLAMQDASAARRPMAALSEQEMADLLHMREEEKLARDVYITLNQQWNLRQFANISISEQRHMDSVAALLARYKIADPVAGLGVGVFATQEFQDLYDSLVAAGSKSVVDALTVGAAIEEIDIVDLDECIAHTTHKDIANVYSNLRIASESHLRAFVGGLAANGVVYVPQYLDHEAYEEIIGG